MTTTTTSGPISGGAHRERRPALAEVPTDRTIERVVLATDGGAAGLAAMHWIADRARARTLDLSVLDVVDVPDLPGWEAGHRWRAADRAVRHATDYLAWAAASVNCSAEVVAGDPRDRIVGAAAGADLLVLGTNRVGASRHFVASFSTKVAEASSCPTVVVPSGWECTAGPVLIGVAGDGSDDAALDFAAREAEVLHRDLVMVHAWHLTGLVAPPFAAEPDRRDSEAAAGDRLSTVANRTRDRHPGLRVLPLLAHDTPVDAVVHAGAGASLVVVGSHGLSIIDRALFTSVSRGVLKRPSCPVAIVRPPTAEA
jgi:nucleotide-binding universal stress UspA family protein